MTIQVYYYHKGDDDKDYVTGFIDRLTHCSHPTTLNELPEKLKNNNQDGRGQNNCDQNNCHFFVFFHDVDKRNDWGEQIKEIRQRGINIWGICISKGGYGSLDSRPDGNDVVAIPYDLKRLTEMLTDDQIKRFNESLENGGPPDIEALLPPRPDLLVACYLLLKLELSTESLAANDQISGHMKYWKEKLKLKLTNGEENAENPIISVDNLRCILEKVL